MVSRSPQTLLFVLLACVGTSHGNEEISVSLPGGEEMVFVWIEPGTFVMGLTSEQFGQLDPEPLLAEDFSMELPAHEVTLTRGFYLAKYEMTRSEWTSVVSVWSVHELCRFCLS